MTDQASEWVEETLSQVLDRHYKEKKGGDRELLLLFRLLAVKYRIKFPLKGQKLKIELALIVFLERWICTACLSYFKKELSLESYTGYKDSEDIEVEYE